MPKWHFFHGIYEKCHFGIILLIKDALGVFLIKHIIEKCRNDVSKLLTNQNFGNFGILAFWHNTD